MDDLIEHTVFKGFTPEEEEPIARFYSEMLHEWNHTKEGKARIELLVLFIRGSRLPMYGWKLIDKIVFQKDFSDGLSSPHSLTLTSTLQIQPYDTKEAFVEAIVTSLDSFKVAGCHQNE